MVQQDLQSINGYLLGIASLIISLFIPFAALMLRIFKTNTATLLLGLGIPFIAVLLGVLGLIKSSKQETSLTKISKILNICAITVGALLIAFNLYVLLNSGGLGGI